MMPVEFLPEIAVVETARNTVLGKMINGSHNKKSNSVFIFIRQVLSVLPALQNVITGPTLTIQ
ncbi:hypothetical protein HHI36_024186, partial [Cryptolaemus montrouzieri]